MSERLCPNHLSVADERFVHLQLGLYLHRQSPNEPIPPASAPPQLGRPGTGGPQDSTGASYGAGSGVLFEPASFSSSASGSSFLATSPVPVIHSFASMHPHAAGSAPSASRRLQTANLSAAAAAPAVRGPALTFRDERRSVKLWFSITACSSLGTALTRFSSTPEVFAAQQSYGWRSSSLRTEEYISPAEGFVPEEDTLVWSGQLDEDRLKCLRATVSTRASPATLSSAFGSPVPLLPVSPGRPRSRLIL